MPANTSPDNIVYPVSTDAVSPLETVFANMAQSVQDALTGNRTPYANVGALPGSGITGQAVLVASTPGAWWQWDGSAWQMRGTAVFADTTARDSAIVSPSSGWLSYTADTQTTWRYSGSAWTIWSRPKTAFTATLNGYTRGNGTHNSFYTVSSGVCELWVQETLGSSSSVSNNLNLTTPLTMVDVLTTTPAGELVVSLSGAPTFGALYGSNSTTLAPRIFGTAATYANSVAPGASTPGSWASGDLIRIHGSFPVA